MKVNVRELELIEGGFERAGDVARLLSVSRSTVYTLMDRGDLPYIKVGKCRRIPRDAVLAYVAHHRVQSSAG